MLLVPFRAIEDILDDDKIGLRQPKLLAQQHPRSTEELKAEQVSGLPRPEHLVSFPLSTLL